MTKTISLIAMMLITIGSYAQAVNDEPCNAINIPVENTGCEPTVTYSYSQATATTGVYPCFSNNPNPLDVWYKVIVPASGNFIFKMAAAPGVTGTITGNWYLPGSCSGQMIPFQGNNGTNIGCVYNVPYSGTATNLTPGATVYLRIYDLYNASGNSGSFKFCVSNIGQLADEPCSAGFLDVESSDPLGQACVPSNLFSWTGATLTPAIPNPTCGVILAADIRDVWCKIRVPASGKLSINFLTEGSYNTIFLALYNASACNGTYTQLYCGYTGTFLTGLAANSIIYARFYIYSNGAIDYGTIKLCASDYNTVPVPDNSKKVGIGIDSPFAKLDVVGTGIFRDKLTAGSDLEVRGNLIVQGNVVSRYNVNGGLKTSGSLSVDSIAFNNRLGNHLSLYGGLGAGGQYGFGIQGATLQMYSDATASNIAFGSGNSNSFAERARIINQGADGMSLSGRLVLKNGTADINNGPGVWLNNPANSALLGFIGTQNSSNIGFYGGPAAWGMVYNVPTGNVGIGTSNPTASLMISSTNNPNVHIRQTNTADFARLRMQTGTNRFWDVSSFNDPSVLTNDKFNFYNSAVGDVLTIRGDGFVGIGNTNPTRPLSFPASTGEKILLYPGGTGEVGIGVYGNELRLHADNASAKVSFGTQTNAGVYSENAMAQRNGVFAFSILGSLWVNGTTYASDERFKQNITSISTPLDKLLQINGVEYEMKTAEFAKNNFQTGRQMGLLAQNVEKIIPEAVNEKDGYKGVDYARLVPLLIESIKAQQQQITAQEKKLNELQAQIDLLKK